MKRITAFAISAACLMFSTAHAEDTKDTPIQIQADQEWQDYIKPLLPIGKQMVTRMADPQDVQLRQEMYRAIFASLSSGYLAMFNGSPDHPTFWPIWNNAYGFFAANPDDAYSLATISDDGVYRIAGYRGTVHAVDFSMGSGTYFTRGTAINTAGPTLTNFDLDKLHIGKNGYFEVILSRERPAGYKGDWWQLKPKATYLLVRQMSYDWLKEVDARLTIERLDRPALTPRASAQEIETNLKQVSEFAENYMKMSFHWLDNLRAQGLINKALVHDLISQGGPTHQKYIEGLYEVAPDEALIYETEVPKQCRYWNIELTDMLWIVEYANRQSSINGFTAKLDKDSKFRAVISATDPGVPNWLDNAGYEKGAFFGRWTGCSSAPTPTLTKVKLADLRKHLPADTPVVTSKARDEAVRLRRMGAQLRRKW